MPAVSSGVSPLMTPITLIDWLTGSTRPPSRVTAQRFNRMVVDHARAGRLNGHLAAPLARTGVPVNELGLLALAAVFDAKAADPTAAARHGLSILAASGRRPLKENRPIDDDGEAIAFLAERMTPLLQEQMPVWRRLGVL
jgi:hypothetical protein